MGCLGGCYRHVVRAEGPGTADTPIYEPNLQDDPDAKAAAQPKKVSSQTVPTKKAP